MTAARTRRAKAGAKLPGPTVRRGTRRFVILTGLSGSGKTQAIRALEDLGYFCVDNLPVLLINTFAELASREEAGLEKVAIVVDVRERGFLSHFPRIFRRLKEQPSVNPTLIFLEASHSTLVRRFSETRRPHPLAPDRSVTEGCSFSLRKIRGNCDRNPRSLTSTTIATFSSPASSRLASSANVLISSTGRLSTQK